PTVLAAGVQRPRRPQQGREGLDGALPAHQVVQGQSPAYRPRSKRVLRAQPELRGLHRERALSRRARSCRAEEALENARVHAQVCGVLEPVALVKTDGAVRVLGIDTQADLDRPARGQLEQAMT